MLQKLNKIVSFRGERLFNGAVDINWFATDESKSKTASQAFVFHGPKYHGVQQEDVGLLSHGHRLLDTASLTRSILRLCYGLEDQPFTLAIAGYGTGKSHFGLTLASLVSAKDSEISKNILSAIESADSSIGSEIRSLLEEAQQPCLALTLNGMQHFDLTAEITKQIIRTLKANNLDPKPLDELRPRFNQAASLINMSSKEVIKELIDACKMKSIKELLSGLEHQDDQIYVKIHNFFASHGMTIRALSGESVRDVIDVTVREYCGKDKPFRSLLVLFDEFGKYTEFATVSSHITGSGVLQDLFEAIQANANNACFVGFIQFELNAYIQRVAPEHKNEILRYVTRYQSANRVYLSINLETLIASLIDKHQTKLLDKWFDNEKTKSVSKTAMSNIAKWFPQSKNHRLWNDFDQFHNVIRKGCWPLSPYSTWFLFFLASAGKHLQERSALALLGDVFQRYEKIEIPETGEWSLSPADLWSDMLQQELIGSEETGQQGSIAQSYASVMAKYGPHLSLELQKLLCAVVLASKLGLQVDSKNEAIKALESLTGLSSSNTEKGIRLLQEEYNVLEWDEAFKAFDILGDAVSRNQFLSYVRQRVASSYDEVGKSKLFASKAAEWCDLLGDLDCDFSEEHKINTREWYYQSVTSNLEYLPQQIKIAYDHWQNAVAVDEPRGSIIYIYIGPDRDLTTITSDIGKLLLNKANEANVTAFPILIVLLIDDNGTLGQSLAEYAVLDESVKEEDRVRFGNLIGAHKEKLRHLIRDQIDKMIKQRHYITGINEELETRQLRHAGSELFNKIYTSPINFPFDGFGTAKGNAADTCQELTRELFLGKLDYEGVISKPVKSKNRALTVLQDTWGIFTKKGDVSRRPSLSTIRSIIEKWDDALAEKNHKLLFADSLRDLCKPPFGANIASAGLLMSIFIAPRIEKLVAVANGQQISVSQLVQDGIFRGKFIDLSVINDVYFILLGKESSQWETLLDEWEKCEDHLSRENCLERAEDLKLRVPIPPSLTYRELHLREQAASAIEAREKIEKKIDDAEEKIAQGEEHHDIALIAWGASEIKKICNQMNAEKPLWTDSQISENQPNVERSRQLIIMYFKEWLAKQVPKADTPDAVGDFKHKMLRLIGQNVKNLGLESLYNELEAKTNRLIQQAELIADVHQLIRNIHSWIAEQQDLARFVQIAKIRDLRDAGNNYIKELEIKSKEIKLTEITEARSELSAYLAKLQDTENKIMKKGLEIWKTEIVSETDIDHRMDEVETLVSAFENSPNDLADFQVMREALKKYQKDYKRLADENLNWKEYENLIKVIQKEWESSSEEELPWPPEKTLDNFVKSISMHRTEVSTEWINSLKKESKSIATMLAPEANRLHAHASNSPVVIIDLHIKLQEEILKKIEFRLADLKIEWLIEKFNELSDEQKKEFLRRIN
ncbi:MAG: hypothetical protein KKH73_07540 [Actinobacteria bacterium]|nr:hypothetical protein [Actinomycetota bacterium]